MKLFAEKTYRFLFKAGVVIKGLISLAEIVAGIGVLFVSYETINRALFNTFGNELIENPNDIFWNFIFREFKNFSATPQGVWAFIFLSHGIVKIFFVGGLWKGKLWAYPASAIIFTFFVAYQCYQLVLTPSVLLELITIFDIALIALITREYFHKRKALRAN
jgi:uncharacterized membrane protein